MRVERMKPGTACPSCEKGKLVFPNEWWKNELKQLRCNFCFETARVEVSIREMEKPIP